mgnify:FL=1
MLSLFIKVCMVIALIFFINKYDLVEKLDDIIKGKLSLKEGFNNIVLPKEEAIKIMIEDQLPIYNLGLVNEGNYLDEMSIYFKRHIFPIKGINTKGSMDNIFQLIDNTNEDYRIDMAFVDEEILINYINNHNHIRSNFKDKLISNKLPPINFSVLGVCFHQSFLFMTGKNSGILSYEDIKNVKITEKDSERNVKIGVLNKYNSDYYHMLKLFYLTDINFNDNEDVEVVTYNNYNELGNALYAKEVDIIYLTSNKKNKMIFEITKAMKCRFISPKITAEKIRFITDNETVTQYNEPPFIIKKNQDSKLKTLKDIYSKTTFIYYLKGTRKELKKILNLTDDFIPTDNTIENIEKIQLIELDETNENYKKSILTIKRIFNNTMNISNIFSPKELKNIIEIPKITKTLTINDVYDFINSNINIALFLPQKRISRMRLLNDINMYNYNAIDIKNEKSVMKNLDIEKAKQITNYRNRGKLIKNMFHIIFDKTENLNTSYRNINTSINLDTYSTRMLLVARNDLEERYVRQVVENMILNLNGLKENINDFLSYETSSENTGSTDTKQVKKREDYKLKTRNLTNPYVKDAFDFNSLVSIKDIPIHKGAKPVYEKYGLIKSVEIEETNVK